MRRLGEVLLGEPGRLVTPSTAAGDYLMLIVKPRAAHFLPENGPRKRGQRHASPALTEAGPP